MSDGIKVEILTTHDALGESDKKSIFDAPSSEVRRVHEFEVGQVVTLNATKAKLFIERGWAKQVA